MTNIISDIKEQCRPNCRPEEDMHFCNRGTNGTPGNQKITYMTNIISEKIQEFEDKFTGKIKPTGYLNLIGESLLERTKHADWLYERDFSIKDFIRTSLEEIATEAKKDEMGRIVGILEGMKIDSYGRWNGQELLEKEKTSYNQALTESIKKITTGSSEIPTDHKIQA